MTHEQRQTLIHYLTGTAQTIDEALTLDHLTKLMDSLKGDRGLSESLPQADTEVTYRAWRKMVDAHIPCFWDGATIWVSSEGAKRARKLGIF